MPRPHFPGPYCASPNPARGWGRAPILQIFNEPPYNQDALTAIMPESVFTLPRE